MSRTPLSSDILEAFGICDEYQPLAGGRALCFRAGDKVLKPSDNDEEAQWIATFITSMIQQNGAPASYALPQPIPYVKDPHAFVFRGWTVWSLLPGQAKSPERIPDILRVSQAFHGDIAKMNISKPSFLDQPTNRFQEADLVAWDEKPLEEVAKVDEEIYGWFKADIERLKRIKRPFPSDLPNQLIHGDLTGNVLFDESHKSLPGIIDMTFYWRPALWAEAIVIADGLAWHQQDQKLVELYGLDEFRLQLLVRALYWRIMSFTIDPEMAFVRAFVPTADYTTATKIVEQLITGSLAD
ncbi:hypothetical protein HJFPF1_08516 [Paramyrothecium foliicola]|nr:hypothetical protein HJFPF1_08516 [Paramyrothecium foliicola]